MIQTDTDQFLLSTTTTSSNNVEQLSNIHPRLCILHKWPHFDGYGIHLTYNKHWRGLHIEDIESHSPGEHAGLLRQDIILAVNGRSIEYEDFFVILSFIQQELQHDQIRFLVLDPSSAEFVRRYQLKINENHENCIRIETPANIQSFNIKNNSSDDPRICSISLRPGGESIGISITADTDFSHVITHVRLNSPAARVGIEENDCIIFLNNILLLDIPFEDVLYHLAKIHNQTKLDFLVAKKSYLLQLSPDQLKLYTNDQTPSSLKIVERNRASTLPDIQKRLQLERNVEQQTIRNEEYDRRSLQIYGNINKVKHKKRHGKILDGIGPATGFRLSWSDTSQKEGDYGTIRSNQYSQKLGTDETIESPKTMKDILYSLQVGMTNPSPKIPTRRIPSYNRNVSFSNEKQSTPQTPSFLKRFYNPHKVLSRSNPTIKTNHVIQTPSPLFKYKKTIQHFLPSISVQSTPAMRFRKQDTHQISQPNLYLATIPVAELPNHDYELYNIKLIKPKHTIPHGFQLTKQTDPFQYIITDIVEQSPADLSGLKVNDWLLKIEDNDIRLTDLEDILKNINQLFTNEGFVNMVIARKKSTCDKTRLLSSVGLSNPNQPLPKKYSIGESSDSQLNKIRHITLKDSSGLYFSSIPSDTNNQIQIHYINNIQPISLAYRSGLRNNDRILSVNDVDVTNTSSDDLRLMLLKKKPLELTVIRDSKYLELIENYKRKQSLKSRASTISSPSMDYAKFKDMNSIIFTDEEGSVYFKHCIIKKDSSYDELGFSFHTEEHYHVISNVKNNYPAYNSGLRDDDIILFINTQNVQQIKHHDVKDLLRSLVVTNETIDLIVLPAIDLQRYRNYQKTKCISWYNILSKIYPNLPKEKEHFPAPPDSRICVVETVPDHPFGFSIEGAHIPPYSISKIKQDSPAEKAGLQVNDILLSINGQSVVEKNYDDTIQIIKDASQQQFVQFIVKQSTTHQKYHSETEADTSYTSSSDEYDDDAHCIDAKTFVNKTSKRDANSVQEYQKQRTKELSYTLRLCHLNTTNNDGTPAASFGFEVTEDAHYEYPIISHVELKSPGERSGLQKDDILLKINNRKTQGLDFEKIKRIIDRARRDGKLEMLVIDKEAFNYCLKTHKKFKEPYIKVKHIFPRTRSSAGYHSLPLLAAHAAMASHECLSTQAENEENNLNDSKVTGPVHFDLSSPTDEPIPQDISSKFTDPARRLSTARHTVSAANLTQHLHKEPSTDESIVDYVLNTMHNLFHHHHHHHNSGSDKSHNLDYDIPPDRTNHSKTNTPLLANLSKEMRPRLNLHNLIQANQSNASYDYIKDPRRCVLKIDRNKGLGFVLSANRDYDHIITGVDKNSIADEAGLQVNDEIVEINGIDVRNVKYEQVVDMLISAMQTNDTIEMYVTDSHVYSSTMDGNKEPNSHSLSNGNNNNNNNNNNSITSKDTTSVLDDYFTNKYVKNSPITNHIRQTINTSYPDLHDQSKYLKNISNRGLTASVPALSTGITASPKYFRSIPSTKQDPPTKIFNISKSDAPVARLCRIQKFPSSPFYGFFLCGNPKKLGQVYISNITKNSSAAVCGLRNGDHIIEVNGTNVQTLTYETILNIIKLHMENEDLQLLVLDKKSFRWYRKRNHPITSQTLPTIVHIQPIINHMNLEK